MAGIFFRPKRETFLIADFILCLKPFTQSEIKKNVICCITDGISVKMIVELLRMLSGPVNHQN